MLSQSEGHILLDITNGHGLALCCFVVYSTRRFVLCLTFCYFVLVLFCPFTIAITSLGEDRANLSAFRTFVRFVLVWFFRFPLPLGVWEGLRFVIVALPGLFSYLSFLNKWLASLLMIRINVKIIAFGNKEHTTDQKMGVSILLRLFISSNEVCNTAYTL